MILATVKYVQFDKEWEDFSHMRVFAVENNSTYFSVKNKFEKYLETNGWNVFEIHSIEFMEVEQ